MNSYSGWLSCALTSCDQSTMRQNCHSRAGAGAFPPQLVKGGAPAQAGCALLLRILRSSCMR
eukprot:949430-Pyramimonas_sp.AAC.1